MSFSYNSVGKKIREIRKQKHVSQLSLSEQIDRSPQFISYIEGGKKNMSLDTFVAIANSLNVSADVLLGEQLNNSLNACGQELGTLLADCSDYERRLILNVLQALKTSMRESRPLLDKLQE